VLPARPGSADQCCRGLKPGVPEDPLHLDENLVVFEVQFLRNPENIALRLERLVIINVTRFAALDEGCRNPASATSEHDDADMSLFFGSVELFLRLIGQFQYKLAH
jgi:hypothetical protein